MLSPARFLRALGNVRRLAQQTQHVSGAPFAIAAYWLAVRTPPLRQQRFRFHWRHHPFWARPADGVAFEEFFIQEQYCFIAPLLAATDNGGGPVVIDAGANIGLFSLAVLLAQPLASVYSLEPDTRTFRVLNRNVRENPGLRWQAFPLALWKTVGPLTFGATDQSTASRVYELAPSGRVEQVDAITLSAFVDAHRLKKITLLKIDIEGAEEAVLTHDNAVLDRVEHLVLEIHSDRVDETAVMRLVRAHLPHVHRFTRHVAHRLLILASRSADAGRHGFTTP
jgi:FkbM family methyltransferase